MEDSPRKTQWWLTATAAVVAVLTLFYYTGSWIMVALFFALLGRACGLSIGALPEVVLTRVHSLRSQAESERARMQSLRQCELDGQELIQTNDFAGIASHLQISDSSQRAIESRRIDIDRAFPIVGAGSRDFLLRQRRVNRRLEVERWNFNRPLHRIAAAGCVRLSKSYRQVTVKSPAERWRVCPCEST